MEVNKSNAYCGMNNTSCLEAALSYAEKGLFVLPICPPKSYLKNTKLEGKSGKLPISVTAFLKASNQQNKVIELFKKHKHSNVGILTGIKSGLIIIDVDYKYGGKESLSKFNFPKTRAVETGNGMHLYYRHPGKGTFVPSIWNKLAPGIDIKGDQSCATLPPSIHASGTIYKWVNEDAPVADLPPKILEQILSFPKPIYFMTLLDYIIKLYAMFPIYFLLNELPFGRYMHR
jgi:hypothetical protein